MAEQTLLVVSLWPLGSRPDRLGNCQAAKNQARARCSDTLCQQAVSLQLRLLQAETEGILDMMSMRAGEPLAGGVGMCFLFS